MTENSVELTKKTETQLPKSTSTYVKPTYNQTLEELITAIFGLHKAICYTSTSTAHILVISTIIKSDDLIILDQQVHFSVQYPCRYMQLPGTTIKMVRHSDYEALEEMLKKKQTTSIAFDTWSMGLNNVKSRIRLFNGDVKITSRIKVGTKFSISIPVHLFTSTAINSTQ